MNEQGDIGATATVEFNRNPGEADLRKRFEAWGCTVLAVGVLLIGREDKFGEPRYGTFTAVKYHDPKHPDDRERIYVVGWRPIHSKRTYYRFEGDARDWYVACHTADEGIKPEHAEHNPFGEHFVIMPWASDQPIDAGHRGVANRCPAKFFPMLLRNKSMLKMLRRGEAIDLKDAQQSEQGTLLVENFVDGKDYCDSRTERWVQSIGRSKRTGEALAAFDTRFYQHPDFECIWLR